MNCLEGRAHHWLIDTPGGGATHVPGVCRLCGAEKLHKVAIGELDRTPAGQHELTIHRYAIGRLGNRPSISATWVSRRDWR